MPDRFVRVTHSEEAATARPDAIAGVNRIARNGGKLESMQHLSCHSVEFGK